MARHAGARQVHIGLTVGADSAVLTIADDGRGASPEELKRPTSFGVAGMRERALAVGGEVRIDAAPGRGTTLTVRVPTVAPAAAPR